MMVIEDLCSMSGVSKPSIYRYMRMGLLPKPLRTGFKKQLVWDESHLELLKKIRHLREDENLSFPKIKNLLKAEAPGERNPEADSQVKKDQIMDKGIDLFSRYGFSNTKVSDITDALGVAKGTFYLYFKSKRDLFLECIGRLTMIIIPSEIWEDVRKESDFIQRQRIKLNAFLKVFPRFSGILNLLRFSLQSDDPGIASKAREAYDKLGKHLVKDMHKAIKNNEIREVNVEIMGLLLQGMAESLGYIPLMDPQYTYELGSEIFLEFMRKGLLLSETEKGAGRSESWSVEDLKGMIVQIQGIRFGGNRHLSGVFGEGEIRVDMENLSVINMLQNGTAIVTSKNGEEIKLAIDESALLSGQSAFGEYSAPLSKIARIYAALPSEKNSQKPLTH